MRAPDHILVIGTRPEAIKCAPIIAAFTRNNARHRLLVVFSGQQPVLLDKALPDLEVDIRMPEWPHELPPKQQRKMVAERFRHLFAELGCGAAARVIVQGDTSTAYLAALAAKRVGAQLHHVEAGLRSGCLHNPFPEEFHRRAITRLADQHYAPTDGARNDLLGEGISAHDILVTGNTGIDSLVTALNGGSEATPRDVVLISLHRRENHGAAVHRIMGAVLQLAAAHQQFQFIWVEHSHPAITKELAGYGRSPSTNVRVCGPLPYTRMAGDSARYALVMTDSGGMQEEAAHLGIPLMVLRDRTERPEALDPDLGVLCPPHDHHNIIKQFGKLIQQERKPRHVFGDGKAAERIVAHLLSQAPDDSNG